MDYFEKHKAIYETYFEAFLTCRDTVYQYIKGTAAQVFRFRNADTLLIAAEKLIDQLVVDIYDKHLSGLSFNQLFAMAEYIYERAQRHAQVPHNAGYRKRGGGYSAVLRNIRCWMR